MPETNKQDKTVGIIKNPPLEPCVTIGDVFIQYNSDPFADTVNFFSVVKVLSPSSIIVRESNQSNLFEKHTTYSAPIPYDYLGGEHEVVFENGNIYADGLAIGAYLKPLAIDIGASKPIYYHNSISIRK